MLKETHAKDHDLGNQSISFPTLTLSVGGLSVCDTIPIKVQLIVPGKTAQQRGVVQKQIIAPLRYVNSGRLIEFIAVLVLAQKNTTKEGVEGKCLMRER